MLSGAERWEETKKTLELMIEHGINNVRGAEYCQVADFDRADARRMSYAAAHHLQAIDREKVERKFEISCSGPPPSSRLDASSPPYQKKMWVSENFTQAFLAPVAVSPLKRVPSISSSSGDVLGRLRSIRDSCAKYKGIPSYAVFTNKTLQEMAEVLPTTEEMFLSIKGVGKVKCQEYGSIFMSAIQEEMTQGMVQYCESCVVKINVDPYKPSCYDCYRTKRYRK